MARCAVRTAAPAAAVVSATSIGLSLPAWPRRTTPAAPKMLAAAELMVAAKNARAELLAGRGDVEQVVRLENLANRAVKRLGIKPPERPRMSLRDRLIAEAEAMDAAEEAAGDEARTMRRAPGDPMAPVAAEVEPDEGNADAEAALALQLHFLFEVCAPRFGLVGAPPERPCDDVGGLDAPLCELDGDAADFLDRPADQECLVRRRGSVFLGAVTFAWWRMTAIMAKASMTNETWRCQPCQERVSL